MFLLQPDKVTLLCLQEYYLYKKYKLIIVLYIAILILLLFNQINTYILKLK